MQIVENRYVTLAVFGDVTLAVLHRILVSVVCLALGEARLQAAAYQTSISPEVAELLSLARSDRLDISVNHLKALQVGQLNELQFRAIDEDLPTLLELTLNAGADPNAVHPDGSGLRPLDVARNRSRTKAVSILCRHPAIQRQGFNDLMLAVVLDDFARTTNLLRENHNFVDAKDWGKRDAMFEAKRAGNACMVLTLLQHGASHDYSSFELNIIRGDTNAVMTDIRSGTNVNPRPRLTHGRTPLFMAVYFRQAIVAKQLLANGADPEAQSRNWGTALISAARRGDIGLVSALLDAGADPNHGVEGTTPLVAAVQSRNEPTAMLLLDRGAEPNVWERSTKERLLRDATRHRMQSVVQRLQSGQKSLGDE
jgi:ankyrin repeat protein